jgi:putative transcriptional regulator
MTIRHHPSAELILDYAAGGLAHGPALAVASHLSLCPHCRREAQRLEALGARLMADAVAPQSRTDTTFDEVLAKIAQGAEESVPALQPATAVFPHPLRVALGGDIDAVPWKRLGMGAYHYIIPSGDGPATARLLLIPAGRPVPVHTHVGSELTLTLCGAYSDATGRFARGDLQEADDSLTHQPHAAPEEDCICLAVTEAPLRFKSWPARILQPLLGI